MSNYTKCDIEQFEYDKRWIQLEEHKWDFMKSDKKAKEYFEKRKKPATPIIGFVQCELELTGQVGPYSGE